MTVNSDFYILIIYPPDILQVSFWARTLFWLAAVTIDNIDEKWRTKDKLNFVSRNLQVFLLKCTLHHVVRLPPYLVRC